MRWLIVLLLPIACAKYEDSTAKTAERQNQRAANEEAIGRLTGKADAPAIDSPVTAAPAGAEEPIDVADGDQALADPGIVAPMSAAAGAAVTGLAINGELADGNYRVEVDKVGYGAKAKQEVAGRTATLEEKKSGHRAQGLDNRNAAKGEGMFRLDNSRDSQLRTLVEDSEKQDAQKDLGRAGLRGKKSVAREGRLIGGLADEGKNRGPRYFAFKSPPPPPVDHGLTDDGWLDRGELTVEPSRFLPRTLYFENTYLGRSAAFLERERRLDAAFGDRHRPYAAATLPPQAIDPPEDAGLAMDVSLDRQWIDRPGRVFLQVALQGSSRYGWRRPPLDVAVVLDGDTVRRRPGQVMKALRHLLATLGPQDRLGVVLAGMRPTVLAEVDALRTTRTALERLDGAADANASGLPLAMLRAGELLQAASQGQARVPGTQTVLVLTDSGAGHARSAAAVAHGLTVQGAVTSVIDLGGGWAWWPVANAGHGNLHRVRGSVTDAVDAELARASQVIARLLRVNISLAPNVEAIRVLGSRVLQQDEVKRVKAREAATDRQLSRTLGVSADRGEDDDGIQTVIPFFYGGDAHVIVVELWVKSPGPVADVSLRYKDMVALRNATAHASAKVDRVHRPANAAAVAVRRNVRGFLLAEAFAEAGAHIARGERGQASRVLAQAEPAGGSDQMLLQSFRRLLADGSTSDPLARAALEYASRRRISHVALR